MYINVGLYLIIYVAPSRHSGTRVAQWHMCSTVAHVYQPTEEMINFLLFT